jgi:DNA mismatch repair protein MutS2
LLMDNKSIEILEFPQIKSILAGYTSFSASRNLALALEPLADYDQVSLRLRQSAEARRLLSMDSDFSIGGVADVREKVGLAAREGILDPMSLVEIQQTLAAMRQVRSHLRQMSAELPLLWDIAGEIVELHQAEKEIARCLSPSGEVLDRASPELAGVRQQLREARQHLWERLEAIMRTSRGRKIIQEPIITEREGRYVIPVKIEFRKEIKGITHDVSNTGVTVFVEPWVTIELGNTVRELETEEKREVERILRRLSLAVGAHEAEIVQSISRTAEIDLALAKARYARTIRATEPVLTNFSATEKDGGSPVSVKLLEARHPLLGQKAVPLSVEMGRDFSTLVITGPNTGGKTVALKTIGLLSLMTQAGIPIPASPDTCLPVFDSIFADIGDEQSIEQTLSSFSWHVGNIVRIINNATRKSLVLLDELGTSTDPAEGSALACSILLHFLSRGILTAATTHYGDLKAFAHKTPGMQNASFDFDPVTLAPTYHLMVGIPGGSNALATASRLGIPPAVIDEARNMLSKGALELEAMLADIMAEKQKAEAARRLLEKEKREVEKKNAELQSGLEHLQAEEQQIVHETRDRVVREAAELHRQLRQASSDLRKQRTKEKIDQARKALAEVQQHLNTEAWATKSPETESEDLIVAGDTVRLKETDLQATVLSVSEETQEAEVMAGKVKIKLGLDSIEKTPSGAGGQAASAPHKIVRPPAKVITRELDLRGRRADEVEVMLDGYLSDATLANLSEVRIIHGIGTGTVRQIVRDFLAAHPLVKSFRTGKPDEGGDGATMVSL